MKKLSKRNVILLSGVVALVLIIVIVILIKPKSADKGYIEGYKVYLNGGANKIDLLNLYLEEEYPLKGIFKSTNLKRRQEVYSRIIGELDKKIEEEKREQEAKELADKIANNLIKDGLEITDIVIKDKFENVIFTEFTAKNTNDYDLSHIVYKIDFYDNGKFIKSKEYVWDIPFKKGSKNKMTTTAGEYFDYNEAKVQIVSVK